MEKTIIDESWTDEEIINYINQRGGILYNVEFQRNLIVDKLNEKFSVLNFIKCNSKESFTITEIDNPNLTILIQDSSFDTLNITDSKIFKFSTYNSDFNQLFLDEITIANKCTINLINNCSLTLLAVKTQLYLNINKEISPLITVDGSEINGTITSTSNLADLFITRCDGLNIYGKLNSLSITDYNNLVIKKDKEINHEVETNQINTISIFSALNKGSLIIDGIEITKLRFVYFHNHGGIINLLNLKIKKTYIQNSILGQLYLNNTEFIDEIKIKKTDLSNINYSNVKWIPKTYITLFDKKLILKWFLGKKNRNKLRERITELRDNRETYRQLKLIAQNMKNKHDELEFARLENRLLWKEARVSKSMNWQDRFIIFTNRWSADFGQSWWMPLGWLLGIHFILFMCIFNWQFSCHMVDIEKGLGEYFELLNPAHSSPKYINTGKEKVTEFAMRLSGGFFIYHFLRATRKYVQG